ncbi:MAG: flippase activity-associated protein Agl23 [Pyrinomonadaceae bacterium]
MATRKSRSQTGSARRAEQQPPVSRVGGQAGVAAVDEQSRPEVSEPVWRGASLLIIIGAAFLRLYDHALKPLHHDEGVNGFFLKRLFSEGFYQYDPANYHGPTLYYFALLTSKVFGLNTFAIRLVPALFGIGTVWLALRLRKYVGGVAALSAAALLAVSPGAVFLSRYFIHESQFVFFTLAIVVAALRFYDEAEPLYLLLAFLSAALLFATKETAIISVGVLLIALGSTIVYMSPWGIYARLRRAFNGVEREDQRRRARGRQTPPRAVPQTEMPERFERFGGVTPVVLISVVSLALFVLVNILFYSSFFTHAKGINDAIGTFKFWTATGQAAHVHEWYMYLWWLWQEEGALLVLGAAGIVLAAGRADSRFVVFAALWAFGITAAYSLVPYKTPWLTLNLIVPLAIIGGYTVSVIYSWDESARAVAVAILTVALCVGIFQTGRLNFSHYDDDTYPYVYAHTQRDFLRLIDEIKRLATRAGTGEQTAIAVTSPDYWPMPWYLRDYKRVGYHSQITVAGEPIIIGSAAQELELRAALGDQYQRIDSYALRPGVFLVLYVRRDAFPQ